MKLIEKLAKTRIVRRQLPSPADVFDRQREVIKNRLTQTIEQGNFADYNDIITELVAEYDPMDIAAAALKLSQEGYKEKAVEEKQQLSFANTGAEAGMVRLFINAGRAQKLKPEDIVRAIAEEADIPGNIIGLINIYEKFTFVEVPEDIADRVMSVMHKSTIKGYKINVEPAKGR